MCDYLVLCVTLLIGSNHLVHWYGMDLKSNKVFWWLMLLGFHNFSIPGALQVVFLDEHIYIQYTLLPLEPSAFFNWKYLQSSVNLCLLHVICRIFICFPLLISCCWSFTCEAVSDVLKLHITLLMRVSLLPHKQRRSYVGAGGAAAPQPWINSWRKKF